jgi:hypothetical protein
MATEEQLKSIIRQTVLRAHKAFAKKAPADRSLTNLEKAKIITDAIYEALVEARLITFDPSEHVIFRK